MAECYSLPVEREAEADFEVRGRYGSKAKARCRSAG